MNQVVTTEIKSAFDQPEVVETRVNMTTSLHTSTPALIEASAMVEKPSEVPRAHDSMSNDQVPEVTEVPAMIPLSSKSMGCCQRDRQAVSAGLQLLSTATTGVYYKNVEVTRSVHPLQVCSLDSKMDASNLTKVTVGRPLPPAPALPKAGHMMGSPKAKKAVPAKRVGKKVFTRTVSRMGFKSRTSKPTSVTTVHNKVKSIAVRGRRVKKRYDLSSDEQVFLEAATALSNRKLKLVEAREDEIEPQNPPLTSMAMSPPPFALCYSH